MPFNVSTAGEHIGSGGTQEARDKVRVEEITPKVKAGLARGWGAAQRLAHHKAALKEEQQDQ